MSLKSILERYHKEIRVPAMAALVLDKDRILDSGIVGVRRSTRETPASLEDPFHIGSITKSFTCTIAGILLARGNLTWDTKLVEIFPNLISEIHPAYQDITLGMILYHEAGIQSFTTTEEFNHLPSFSGDARQQREQFYQHILKMEPQVKPGSEVLYSNAGYTIAAAMMEQITCTSWEEMIEGMIFTPLGVRAGFGWPAQAGRDEPWGHIPTKSGFQPIPPQDTFPLNLVAPAGHLHMSIKEYAKYLQIHLQGLLGKDTTILKSSSILDLHKISKKFALGWTVEEMGGVLTHRHFGSGGTFFTGGAIQPEREIAAAVFTNAGGEKVHGALHEILISLFNAYAP